MLEYTLSLARDLQLFYDEGMMIYTMIYIFCLHLLIQILLLAIVAACLQSYLTHVQLHSV